jgi:uncharacterized protein (DUF1499 family)
MHIRTVTASRAATISGVELMRWSSMRSHEQMCSQQAHCLSCPLSRKLTGKDCRKLTHEEIHNIMNLFRYLEKLPETVIIESLEEYLRGEINSKEQ